MVLFKHKRKGVQLEKEIQSIDTEDCKPKTLRDYTDPIHVPLEDILPEASDDDFLDSNTQQEHCYVPAATPVPSNRCPIGKKDPCLNWPKVGLLYFLFYMSSG